MQQPECGPTSSPAGNCWIHCAAADTNTTLRTALDGVFPTVLNTIEDRVNLLTSISTLQVANGVNPCDMERAFSAPTSAYPQTDLLVYVLTRPTTANTATWTKVCQRDSTTGRPTIVAVNFSVGKVMQSGLGELVLREILKTMALDSTDTWSVALSTVDRTDEFGFPRKRMANANVLAAARAQFACETLDGAELENGYDVNLYSVTFPDSGIYTQWKYLDKRIFGPEILTGVASPSEPAVWSSLSDAVLRDSGWYTPLGTPDHNPWGYQEGCSFVTSSCQDFSCDYGAEVLAAGCSNRVERRHLNDYFCLGAPSAVSCNDENVDEPTLRDPVSRCSYDLKRKAQCNTKCYPDNITPINAPIMGDNTDPQEGGVEPLADFCPIPAADLGSCASPSSATAYSAERGEYFGDDSACFMSSARVNTNATAGADDGVVAILPTCLKYDCASTTRLMYQIDGLWFECVDNEVKDLDLAGIDSTRPELSGTIQCPLVRVLCRDYVAPADEPAWPKLDRIDPDRIDFRGGMQLTLFGSGFGTNTSTLTYNVTVGGRPCAPVVNIGSDGTMMSCTAPAFEENQAEDLTVTVVDSLGRSSSRFRAVETLDAQATPTPAPIKNEKIVTGADDFFKKKCAGVLCFIWIIAGLVVAVIGCVVIKTHKKNKRKKKLERKKAEKDEGSGVPLNDL